MFVTAAGYTINQPLPCYEVIMINEKYIRFDWAVKRMLRDKANFAVFEGLMTVLIGEQVKIEEILESEGNLNGEKVGDDVSKKGFSATNGDQADGIKVMVYISFKSHKELAAWGYDDTKGKPCLDVAPWDKNEPHKAWSSFTSGEYDRKGTRRFHVHTHPGDKDGRGGFAQPSPIDATRAQNFMSNYYIISAKHGSSQYNAKGKYWEPAQDKTPNSLLPYRRSR